ncbi:Hpt domain-containing protein [Chthonobacter rhizosphaerae]|uniref:Hpt domain-containing protein n=1 Tax=Chthonobacter rhizosphaerae TaxID=2735553 RepID=UPI0015EF203F|nr:Hpt domain-containing protein [Chthonobacter rhizosphaerae]
MTNAALKPVQVPDDQQARPVDLAHLARQTHGNRDLEREVLHLFLIQSERLMKRLMADDGPRLELAHALVGSALGIGAWAVAKAAGRVETAAREAREDDGALPELADAVATANSYIRSLI